MILKFKPNFIMSEPNIILLKINITILEPNILKSMILKYYVHIIIFRSCKYYKKYSCYKNIPNIEVQISLN